MTNRDEDADTAEDDDEEAEDAEDGDGDPDQVPDDNRVGQIYDAVVTVESFNDVKVQFAALGLIEKGIKRRPGSDTSTYWRLTERGRQQLLRLRAIRKSLLVEAQNDVGESLQNAL